MDCEITFNCNTVSQDWEAVSQSQQTPQLSEKEKVNPVI